jgi:class 3 adenylate cyclase/tetratricopeptide (TPR) repeat protein
MPRHRFLPLFTAVLFQVVFLSAIESQPKIDSIRAKYTVLKSTKDSIDYYRGLANAYLTSNKTDSGIAYGKKLLQIYKRDNQVADANKLKLALCRTFFYAEKWEYCYAGLNEVAAFYEGGDNYVAISQVNGMYGGYFATHEKNWDKALTYFLKNIQQFKDGKAYDPWSVQYSFQSAIGIYTYQSQYAEALKIAEENLVYASTAAPELKASAYTGVATLYRNTKNYKKALEASKEALEIYERTNNRSSYLFDLTRQLAADYLLLKQKDSAYRYFQKAIDGYIAVGNKDYAGSLLNYIALQKEEDGDKVTAEKWNEQALSLVKPGSELYENLMQLRHVNKMNFLMDAKGDKPYTTADKDSLRDYLNKIQPTLQIHLNEKRPYFDQNDIELYSMLAKAYEKTDSLEKSLFFLKKSAQVKDSIFDMDKMKSFTDLESAISVEKERNRVLLQEEAKRLQLQKEAEIKALEYEFKRKQALAKTAEEKKRLLLEEDLKRREIEFRYQHEQDAIKQRFKQEQALAKVEQEKKDALAEAALIRSKNVRNMSLLGAALALVLVAIATWSYQQKKKDNLRIAVEKKKSDDLLLNILPFEVAEELKEKGQTSAKNYNEVSVLFTDFVGFTAKSERIDVQDLLAELNVCFTAFDNIMERHGMEKIKTIGDAYLAVSGLPHKNEQHAECAVKAALDIAAFIKHRKAEQANALDIRIGIHSGHVIAGIVGVKKFAYDIWGDTVNTAARMEQNAEAGRINISASTYNLVKGKITMEARGIIQVKGKGGIEMYFVHGALPA